MASLAKNAVLSSVLSLVACGSTEPQPKIEPQPQPTAVATTSVDVLVASSSASTPPVASAPPTSSPPPIPTAPIDRPNVEAAQWLAKEEPAFAPVATAIEAKKYGDAKKALAPLVTTQQAVRPELLLVARTLEAELARATSDAKGASKANAAVLARADDTNALVKEINAEPVATGDADAEHTIRLRYALDAISEALYFDAEEARVKADAKHAPTLSGPASKDAVLKFVAKSIRPWIDERHVLIERAEVRYLKVTKVSPAPSPRWVVASASSVGAMWSAMVDEFRNLPMPAEFKNQPDIAAAYRDALKGASEPFVDHARGAYRVCVDTAERYKVTGDASAPCRAWLDAHPERDH